MTKIQVHPEKIRDLGAAAELCPFGAIEVSGTKVEIGAGCRACMVCVKKGPEGAFTVSREDNAGVDKAAWRGISVFAEIGPDGVLPVSLELVGEARVLAGRIGQPVRAVVAGSHVEDAAREIAHYGVEEICVYDDPALARFRVEPFAAVLEDHIRSVKPAAVLVGGTPLGRSLAPRAAARIGTGLTADCTSLDIRASADLDQIRPAFGGNIMAHIHTPRHRPQFATVRPKIFPTPVRNPAAAGRIVRRDLDASLLASGITVLESKRKTWEKRIEDAEVIVAAGRGFKKKEDLSLAVRLAELLHGEIAGTRSLIEAGWIEPQRQIGLSGRTVKPKLIIACGISGAVQFAAGMKGSDMIVSINTDPNAPITKISHYVVVGSVYEVLPRLIARIEEAERAASVAPRTSGATNADGIRKNAEKDEVPA